MIGIEPRLKLFVEGDAPLGREVLPAPMVSVATIVRVPSDLEKVPRDPNLMGVELVFREDFFDPVTRIRRGRMYCSGGSQPHRWTLPSVFGGLVPSIEACTFHRWPAAVHLKLPYREQIVLGAREAFTLWNVIGVERISTGEDLITLKARSALGVMPELDMGRLPEESAVTVTGALDLVANAVHRAGALDVVDRCRDAAQVVVSHWLAERDGDAEWRKCDLSRALKKLDGEPEPKGALINSVRTLALLHARGKSNEQEKRRMRIVDEGDAEVSVALLGLILRELGWVRGAG